MLLSVALPASAAAFAHGMGLVVKSNPTATPRAATPRSLTPLPASADLTQYAVPVGDQREVNSCAAWATDYTAFGYWERRLGIPGGVLARMYTYSQLVGGQNVGTTIDSHLDIARQQGVDNQADYWQGSYDYTDPPTTAERSNQRRLLLRSRGPVRRRSRRDRARLRLDRVTGREFVGHVLGRQRLCHPVLGVRQRLRRRGGLDRAAPEHRSSRHRAGQHGPPTISGSANQGQTLTATAGSWSPAGSSYSCQWQRSADGGVSWNVIAGATAASYVIAQGDVGALLRVSVTALNGAGSASANSAATGTVMAVAPQNTARPAIYGLSRQGETLYATSGTWSPVPSTYAYRWQRSTDGGASWQTIAGAAASYYALGSADVGASLRVAVTATNAAGSGTAVSWGVGPVALGAPQNTVRPAAA